jgi:undecaprenyl-diphosphatase
MESAAVFALHQWAVSQASAADLALALAQYGVVLLPLAAVALWTRNDDSRDGRRVAILVGVVAAILAFALGLVLERTLHRPRPFVELGFEPLVPHAADSSFPSDHTLVGVAFVGPLLWRTPRSGVALLVWALLVGLARVVVGLHYPSDIVGSALLALLLEAGVWIAMRPAFARLRFDRWIPRLWVVDS